MAKTTGFDGIPVVVDEPETTPIRRETMRELVYGRRLNRREHRLVRVALALGTFLGLSGCAEEVRPAFRWAWAIACILAAIWGFAGCATAPAPVQVETVGTLAAGPSVYSAPVHQATDLVDTFEDSRPAKAKRPAATGGAADDLAAPAVEEKVAHGF